MTRIRNLTTIDGVKRDLEYSGSQELNGEGLILLPALIDPHVHFRVPGGEHKEDWKSASLAAVRGGVTMVCDMPNNNPPCVTLNKLLEKKKLIDAQLKAVGIPLRYELYFGADKDHLNEFEQVKGKVNAIKVFMGCSTGGLLIDTDAALDEVFRRAKELEMVVAVHAEDEAILEKNRRIYAGATDPALHSRMRPREAAIVAVKTAIEKAAKYNTPLYILHMSTKEELELVRQAKREGLPVFAEVTTHHLFLTEKDYAQWKTFVQMNPPLRTQEDQDALWEGIRDGTIDTIGTDHAPHTLLEKNAPFGQAPSGIPGVETLLPLMLDCVNQNRLSLNRLIELTRTNIQKLFSIPPNDDCVLVDMNLEKEVLNSDLKSKCGWTPYHGRVLKGWPIYTILRGRLYLASGFNSGKVEGKRPNEVANVGRIGGRGE